MPSLTGMWARDRVASAPRGAPRRRSLLRHCLICGLAAVLTIFSEPSPGAAQGLSSLQETLRKPGTSLQTPAYKTTLQYVIQFYPLWFTYYQSVIGSVNRLIGPNRISPIYKSVVAINDDTLYASTFVDVAAQPVILTIPSTTATYSILTLDPYGNIFDSGIPAATPGTFGLTGPGFTGTLPQGVTPIALPLDFQMLIFRADKYSVTNEDETDEAEQFRRSLTMQTLCRYLDEPCPDGPPNDRGGDATLILPEAAFSVPFKRTADFLARRTPMAFLRQLQVAVASSNTPPLTPEEKALSDTFDTLFQGGHGGVNGIGFRAGARDAHQMIVDNYLDNTNQTNWINFTNIGEWGDEVLDRASITEYIQYGNGFATAAYFHAFEDGAGDPLNGARRATYVLTFPNGQIPDAKRFWSVTAYTPVDIELVRNSLGKYLVASYTPGLQFNQDGSLSIYMSRSRPVGVPAANWLPVPDGQFNIMIRVYGPAGDVAAGTYIPPAIQKAGRRR